MGKRQQFTISGSVALKKALAEELAEHGITLYGSRTISDYPNLLLEPEARQLQGSNSKEFLHYRLPEQYNEAKEAAIRECKEKETLKEGEWYRYKDGSVARYRGNYYGYGWDNHHFQSTGKYECSDVYMTDSDYQSGSWRKATYDEIKEALGKIAAERGYKEGVKVRSARTGEVGTLEGGCVGVDTASLRIAMGGIMIFMDDKWAEIITTVTPDVTVGGKKGVFEENGVTFGCTFLNKDRIKSLYDFLDHWNKDITNTNTVIETLESVTGVQLHISTLKIMYEYYFGKK